MSMRRVFTVGNEKGLANTAKIIADLFFPHEAIQVVNLSQPKSYLNGINENIETILALGHSNTESIGNYNAYEFSKKMASQFTENQKKSVKHLYIIGCEIGLIQDGGESLAQSIANNLFQMNFSNIQVHCISKPEDAIGECMYVEIIEHAGVSVYRKVYNGYINAYLLSNEDANRLNRLLDNKPHKNDEIDRIISQRALMFIKDANPVDELNKPHHIFIPNETLNARQERIENHPYSLLSREQSLAIDLLTQRRDHEIGKKNTITAQKLNFIIAQLKRGKAENYPFLMKNFVKYYRLRVCGMTLNRKSNTLKLLNYICQGDYKSAQSIIDKQPKKTNHLLQTEYHDHNVALRKKHLISSKKWDKGKTKSTPSKYVMSYDDTVMMQAKNEINDLIRTLNAEIKELSQSCFFIFNRYEIHTKIEKRNALRELAEIKELKELQIKATDHILNSSRVTRSKKTSRTRDLLDKIVNHPNAFVKSSHQAIRAKYFKD